jgi:hypothetical protein
MILTPK